MITHDEGDGIFSFERVGGIDVRQLAGKPVWVGREHIPGVIGANDGIRGIVEILDRSAFPQEFWIGARAAVTPPWSTRRAERSG